MEIRLKEKFYLANIAIRKLSYKNPNQLASVSLTFKGDDIGQFTISSFTLWKSNYGGYNLTVPSTKTFKYAYVDKPLLKKLLDEVVKAYDLEDIPIIEEMEGGKYTDHHDKQ